MATVAQVPGFPYLFTVSPIDVTTEYRPTLRAAIDAVTDGALHTASHDFWFAFPIPPQPNVNPNSPNLSYQDMSIRPRPLRGIIDMRAFPSDGGAATLEGLLATLVHESGHGWLVPTLQFDLGAGVVSGMSADEATATLNADGTFFHHPGLLGRQDCHWNPYLDSGGSIMDGTNWVREPDEGGFHRWTQQDLPVYEVTHPGSLTRLRMSARYGDLDLLIMGMKTPEQTYVPVGNTFTWMTPKLSVGWPMQYHTGIYLAFERGDAIYFGFYNDHRQLRVERSSTAYHAASIDIGPDYRPLLDEMMMLRVVRRGPDYFFQACRYNPAASAFGTHMFDNLGPVGPATDFAQWETVDSLTEVAEPQAIGLFTKTWNPILVEQQIASFELNHDGANSQIPPWQISGTLPPGAPHSSLTDGMIVQDIPQAPAHLRLHGENQILGVPWGIPGEDRTLRRLDRGRQRTQAAHESTDGRLRLRRDNSRLPVDGLARSRRRDRRDDRLGAGGLRDHPTDRRAGRDQGSLAQAAADALQDRLDHPEPRPVRHHGRPVPDTRRPASALRGGDPASLRRADARGSRTCPASLSSG